MLLQLERKLRGIPIGDQFFKALAYADDLTIGIRSVSDWTQIEQIFKTYELASNARVNRHKTKLVPLTENAKRVELTIERSYKKVTEQKMITILGYAI